MSWRLDHGDCVEVMRRAEPNSVDAIVTDPPAGIDFMGRDWDCFRRRHNPKDVGRDNLFGRTSAAAPHSYGESDRGNFIAFMTEVMVECLRVLKPGGHALVWALPRTSHWTATAIEDAGFEVRTVLHHHFGSGFPKSLDVSKQVDKMGGLSAREQAEGLKAARLSWGCTREALAKQIGCTPSSIRDWEEGRARRQGAPVEYIIPSAEYRQLLKECLGYSADARQPVGDAADRRADGSVYGLGHTGQLYGDPGTSRATEWSGWGTAVKPATEHWILARKPLQGTVAENVLTHGTGALNIDACRVERASDDVPGWHKSGSYGREGYRGTDTFKIRDMPPEEVQARCGDKGRWPPDLLLSHGEGCVLTGTRKVRSGNSTPGERHGTGAGRTFLSQKESSAHFSDEDGLEVVESWSCVDGCPVAELDRQSGFSKSGSHAFVRRQSLGDTAGGWAMRRDSDVGHGFGDSGSASRFFPTFSWRYVPKPSRREREAGLEKLPLATLNRVNPGGLENDPRWGPVQVKNVHPTVKARSLMDWLIRLITPPKGLVLDPFAGSGSTGVAAVAGAFSFWGIEQSEEFHRIAEARIAFALAERSGQLSLFDEDGDE